MKKLVVSRGWKRNEADRTTLEVERHSGWAKGWLARITLPHEDDKYDLHRDFIRHDDQFLSRAGNGHLYYYDLPDGIYETDAVWRSFRGFRVYFEVRDGEIGSVTDSKKDAKQWLHDLSLQAKDDDHSHR